MATIGAVVGEGYGTPVRAAVLRRSGVPMGVEEIWLRDPGPDEVRVRIDATGVCHSDLSLATGKLAQATPAVLGHEACGTVVEAGTDVDPGLLGRRVVPLWITPCGRCYFCLHGQRYLCENGSSRASLPYAVDAVGAPVYPGLSVGSFAEQTVVPAASVVLVPDGVATEHAALLGCAVSTGVGAVINSAKVTPGACVLVLGLGGVGMSAVMGARLAGAGLILAVDRNPAKASYAAAGADHFLVAGEDLKSGVRALTGGRGADYALDCVGSAATIRDAWSLTRRGGTACVVGVGGKQEIVSFNALEVFHFARTLTACVAGSVDISTELPRFYDWISTGALNLDPLITGHGQLDQLDEIFAELADGRAIRTILRP